MVAIDITVYNIIIMHMIVVYGKSNYDARKAIMKGCVHYSYDWIHPAIYKLLLLAVNTSSKKETLGIINIPGMIII